MATISPFTQVAVLLTGRWAVNGVPPLTRTELLAIREALGSSQERAEALLKGQIDLETLPGDPERLQSLLGRGFGLFQLVDKWTSADIWIVSWSDERYPERFKQLKGRAPALVFGFGNPNAFSDNALAIVGSRNATEDRLSIAAQVGKKCAEQKITVVSGGARGVDMVAMKGGLEAGGNVVGVLADSLLSSTRNRAYREAIQEGHLCLMSEVHPEARFDVGNAMARNRLAYACADAALIIDCEPKKGGTWAGALDALREEKAVYVLEGASAEQELRELGAIVVSPDFAMNPTDLVKGIIPEGTSVVTVPKPKRRRKKVKEEHPSFDL